MKKLFIYYSYSGNGELIKDYLSENLDFEIRSIKPKKSLPKSFFFGVLVGGFLSGINHKAKLKEYDKDISAYDYILIGSPIWNSKLSCPINTLLEEIDLKNKKFDFLLYSSSGDINKIEKTINKKYPLSKVYSVKEPKKNSEYTKTLIEIGENIK